MIDSDFYGFKKQSKEEWLAKVDKDLRGRDFDEALVTTLWDTIKVDPMYFHEEEDHELLFHSESEIPGLPPRNWCNLAAVEVTEEKAANEKALKLLNQGAEGLIFLTKAGTDFEKLFEGIQLAYIEVFVQPLDHPNEVVSDFKKYLQDSNASGEDLKGGFLWSPTSYAIKTGESPDIVTAREAIEAFNPYPNFKALSIDFSRYAEAGGNGLQELTFGLGEIIETLDQLGDMTPNSIWSNLSFHLSSGSEHFADIAKLKTARRMIAELARLYEVDLQMEDVRLLVSNNSFTKTEMDPYSNLIRQTFEGMAGILGGANSLWIKPEILDESPELFERMAINVSTILREESQLGKVMDPSAGSNYITSLSKEIKRTVLEQLSELEKSGGWMASFENGTLQSQIRENRKMIQEKVLEGELTKVGANKFLRPGTENTPLTLGNYLETELQLKPSRASLLVEKERES